MKFEKYFDHTILKADATKAEVMAVCEDAVKYSFASVCVNSAYTEFVKSLLSGSGVATCVVVGFPLGAMDSDSKAYETRKAIEHGADEIDMVINVGAVKDKRYEYVKQDIEAVRRASEGKILKVIIETCMLTDEEKIMVCELAVEAGADYVKTSTGFVKAGATVADVSLMKKVVGGRAKVKAAGGIRDYNTALAMIEAGADRLGTSATVKIVTEASQA